MAKCGSNTIIGSGATGRLSAWNISDALEEYTNAATNNDGIKNDRIKNFITQPRIMAVDNSDNFASGDLQYMGNSQLLVAPLREYGGNDFSCTTRLFDINAEKVTGIFCGTHQSQVSISKQHCVESHNSIFVMSDSVGVVYDVRTFKPTVALHTGGCEQILGVPTKSSPVAFTYSSRECIKCWDLRMPGSHVYTMGTGNTMVDYLHWHESTSSLLTSTQSNHVVSYGHCRGYMYEESIGSEDEEDMMRCGYWPKRAVHDKNYFGSQWHCDGEDGRFMLQYPFQNGREMHEKTTTGKSEQPKSAPADNAKPPVETAKDTEPAQPVKSEEKVDTHEPAPIKN